jgi:ubiquinone/menaquinone biosynthesis C-methylase UbiE
MEQNVYQQFAELERDHWWFRGRRAVYGNLLKSSLGGEPPGRVLDLGCGLGGFLPSLHQIGFETFGADMDQDSLRYCHERGFTQCSEVDCYRLPYPDDSFDWVTMFDVLEHIEDDAKVLNEVSRVLKPGGSVMISVPAYQFLYANNDRVAQHYRRYTRGDVERVFQRAGLTVDRNTHSNVLLAPLIIPTFLILKAREATFFRKKTTGHTNLSLTLPNFINETLYRIFAAESFFSSRFNLPFGHSIAAIASLDR